MTETLADKLVQSKYRPSGFDYIRLILALSVISFHSLAITYGVAWAGAAFNRNAFVTPAVKMVTVFILPSFFALSGFLVAGSLERNRSLFVFLGLRAIRIVPALSVEVFLSALLLGPLLTKLPLSEYFTNFKFRIYFLNTLGIVHFQLPGVFTQNPIPNVVNGQLWTVPVEMKSYVVLAIMALLGVVRNGRILVIVCVALLVALILYQHHEMGVVDAELAGDVLVLCFLLGVAAYRFRRIIPYRRDLCVAAVLMYLAFIFVPYSNIFIAIPITYATIYLGLWNGRRIALIRSGDYSYGIYIYGFVIQQAIVGASPSLRHLYVALPMMVVVVFCFAAFSWFVVEKPALSSRKHLPVLDEAIKSAIRRFAPKGKATPKSAQA
jgi:peptidoglycan/LPS O-acetylase OafA/YrhL